jgi:hypothetical protein
MEVYKGFFKKAKSKKGIKTKIYFGVNTRRPFSIKAIFCSTI